MQAGSINYLSVLVSAVAYWIIGALWFSAALFGKTWMKGLGKTEEQLKEGFSKLVFLWSFIWSFIASYGIARLMVWTGGNSVADGFMVGLLVAISFVLAPFIINNLFERRPKSLLMVNAFYHFVALIVSGIIIGAWK
jgi:hypothetical protein